MGLAPRLARQSIATDRVLTTEYSEQTRCAMSMFDAAWLLAEHKSDRLLMLQCKHNPTQKPDHEARH